MTELEKTETHTGVWLQVIAGALALFIAMGVGRFAYTPILPLMQSQTHFSNAIAGYLASSNYLGYLIGAFAAGSIPFIRLHRLATFQSSLVVCIVTTGIMGLTTSVWLWTLIRLVSGISSGLVFVLVSSIVLDLLALKNSSKLSGVMYGGVGLGLGVTGLIVPLLGHSFGWKGTWIGLMILTILVGLPTMIWLRKDNGGGYPRPTQTKHVEERTSVSERTSFFPWLTIAYGFEGLGYIITGTFLVTLVEDTPATHALASYCWVIVGLAALPSCILWSFLAARWGAISPLVVAYLLQALGVLLPVVAPNAFGVYVGSILFGGTFMGISAMANNLARNLRPNESSKAIGLITGVYGVGQIVGAAGAGILAHGSGEFRIPIVVAGCLLCIGIVVLLAGRFNSTLYNKRA